MFQYKIIHNILCTKSLLFKMKKEDSHAALFVQQITPSFIFSLSARKPLCSVRSWASRIYGELKIIAFNKRNYVWHY